MESFAEFAAERPSAMFSRSVLFWQTLGLWLPGQLAAFSKLANSYLFAGQEMIITFSAIMTLPWVQSLKYDGFSFQVSPRCMIRVFDAKLLMVSVASRSKFEQNPLKTRLSIAYGHTFANRLIILSYTLYSKFWI